METWTYQSLEDHATELSQYLMHIGITKRHRVGYCFRKSAWAVVSMLAILKAGASCVPLDPDHPKARLETIIDAASISTVLVEHPIEVLADFPNIQQISVNESTFDRMTSTTGGKIRSFATAAACPEHSDAPAFALFTSGSTGVPKAVVLSHSAICSSAKYHGEPMGIGPSSRVYQNAAYTFDMSIYDIFTTLIRGGTVCIPAPDTQMHCIAESVNRLRSNWAFFTPTLLSTMTPAEIPSLHTILLAGEAVSQEIIDLWASQTRLLNGYGSTEMSTCFLTHLTNTSDPREVGTAQGVLTRIVSLEDPSQDAHRGELVVCGPVLASGYLNQSSKTTTGFYHDPTFPDRMAYRTGDVVERTESGSYLFHGRCDTMVKIRGYRVEMGDVESQLMSHPLVVQAVVLYPKKGKHSEKLTAVVKLEADSDPEDTSAFQKTLTDHLEKNLPKYMVPQSWLTVQNMETTSSGKIDRRAIASAVEQGSIKEPYVQPGPPSKAANASEERRNEPLLIQHSTHSRSNTDAALAQTAFMDLGLDSINLISLSKILKKAYGLDLNVATLGSMSLAGLLPCINNSFSNGDTNPNSSSPARPRLAELFTNAYGQLQRSEPSPRPSTLPSPPPSPPLLQKQSFNVFLTGATGFVGTRILQHLIRVLPPQSKIVTLVRASTPSQGLQRIADSLDYATIEFSREDLARLEVWLGDLSKPNFGLDAQQVGRLQGCHQGPDEAIDIVVHNGALVNWTLGYEALSAANVDSTTTLLNSLSENKRPTTMVYVSGGRALEVATSDVMTIPSVAAHDASDAFQALGSASGMWDTIEDSGLDLIGYDIAKLMSDALVKSSTSCSIPRSPSGSDAGLYAHIIRPGYIIGDSKTGQCNADDYIWRVVATALNLGKRCKEPATAFLHVSGVDDVSEQIVRPIRMMCEKAPNHILGHAVETNIGIGVTMHDFWATVSVVYGIQLESQPSDAWVATVDKSMTGKENSEAQPLYPVMEAHRGDGGLLGLERPRACEQGSDARALQCLEKSLMYLQRESNVFKRWLSI
jgi:amino acid adenylation domain-containing protein/thioester reductase-like protein